MQELLYIKTCVFTLSLILSPVKECNVRTALIIIMTGSLSKMETEILINCSDILCKQRLALVRLLALWSLGSLDELTL